MKLKPFDAAYLRLTGWYVLIIMIISLLFSFWVYNQARQELLVGLNRVVEFRPVPTTFRTFIDDRLDDSRQRLIARLVLFNGMVLGAGAAASYWLARRTLRPLEESVDAQHRFTADASHELRTPLAAMKSEIEVGLRDKKLTKDEAVHLLESNLEEIDRLSLLSEDLLALTQSDVLPEVAPISLEEITNKVAHRLEPLATAKHIELKRTILPMIVTGDEQSVDKIIGILLDNAIKYSHDHTTIMLKTSQKDGKGYVTVIDQGVGIKASELPHIFERFYRADTSRSKTHVAGHGLGLSIAQKLAESLNGTITVESTPGKGSVFALSLPLARMSTS